MAWIPRPFVLYWSNLEKYENCPQGFLWGRGWGSIDVGGGPGRRKPVPEPSSRHHAIMGIVIQYAIEKMYNDQLWRDPKGLADRLVAMGREEFEKQLLDSRNFVDWTETSRADMLRTIEQGILGYLRTMKAHRLLGPFTRAEHDMVASIHDPVAGKDWIVGGKADVVFEREESGVTFLDGKNAQSKGKYTDPDQLRWYSLLWFLTTGKLPDRLAFVYYRYPHGFLAPGSSVPETGIDWVDFNKADIDSLSERALAARRGMEAEQFDPTPKPPICRFCDYESVCKARQEQKAANRRPRKEKVFTPGGVSLQDALGDDGFFHFGLGGPDTGSDE